MESVRPWAPLVGCSAPAALWGWPGGLERTPSDLQGIEKGGSVEGRLDAEEDLGQAQGVRHGFPWRKPETYHDVAGGDGKQRASFRGQRSFLMTQDRIVEV